MRLYRLAANAKQIDGRCWKSSAITAAPAPGSKPPSCFDALVSLLRLYGKQNSLCKGRKLHTHIVCCGLDRHTFLCNAIIQFYASCKLVFEAQSAFAFTPSPNVYSWNLLIVAYGQKGLVDHACRVFHSMPARNVVSWNAMIGAYAQNSYPNEALDIFHCMYVEGITPDNVTFVSALDACACLVAYLENNCICPDMEDGLKWAANACNKCTTFKVLQEAHGMHMAIVEMGYHCDVIIGNVLINIYGKLGNVHNAVSLFHMSQNPNVITWTAMIATFSQSADGETALLLFRRITLEGVIPNNVTLACALDACATLAALQEGKHIHATLLHSEHKEDCLVGNALVSMYGKCKCVRTAEMVFSNMCHRDVVSWNAIIATLSQNGCAVEALNFYRHMQAEGLKPDRVTYVCTIDACASLLALEEGHVLHTLVVMMGCEHLGIVGSALVSMYGNCRFVHEAQSVFDRIQQHDLVLWNAMIAAFTLNECGTEALKLFHQMKSTSLQADKITFWGVLDACANLAALEEGREIHLYIDSHGYSQDTMVGTALLDMYAKCGSVLEAKGVFDKMWQRNVVTWTAMISAFAQNGDGKEALNLFSEMHIAGVEPDTITFISIFNACSYIGSIQEGVHYFLSMERYCSLDLELDHYLSMIDLLGRAGCLDEAESLIHKVPFENVGVSWECLLAACRVHGDFCRGFRAASHCFEVYPRKAAPFVTLDNLYFKAVELAPLSMGRYWEEIRLEVAA